MARIVPRLLTVSLHLALPLCLPGTHAGGRLPQGPDGRRGAWGAQPPTVGPPCSGAIPTLFPSILARPLLTSVTLSSHLSFLDRVRGAVCSPSLCAPLTMLTTT